MGAQGTPIALVDDTLKHEEVYEGLVSSKRPLPVTSHGLEIAKGNIPGHTVGVIFGHNDDLDPANPAMIWDYGEFQHVEAFLTADTELFMSSTSASDTNVGVLIFGMTDDYA